jgi:hypothetical protein
MPKFNTIDEEPTTSKPAMDQLPPATKGAAASIQTSYADSGLSNRPSTISQVSEAAQLAAIELEREKWKAENSKQEEPWMKSMWRPAMGWLYMLMCFSDFVAFPIISMFLPQFVKSMTYIPWKSITLDNGGLIHMAFGAILGVAAWTRGQEKIAGKQ